MPPRLFAIAALMILACLAFYAVSSGQWRYLAVLALLPLLWIALRR